MQKRPNIILIYTDQQRFDTIAALGNKHIKTPNLDSLVSEGVAFTHATTPSPVCMSARWSLLSGQWPSTHKCYSNHHPGTVPHYNLCQQLHDAGYKTALVGKNHSFLTEKDMDVWDTDPKPVDYQKVSRGLNSLEKRTYSRLIESSLLGGVELCTEKAKTDKALEFIDSCDNQPFFLWLSYIFPHTPYMAPEPYYSMYKDADVPPPVRESTNLKSANKPFRQIFHQRNNDAIMPFDEQQTMMMKRVYYAMIGLVDEQVGRVLDYLETKGIAKDTLLVFTSDHGDYMGDHGLYTKSPALYDCLVRIPMVVRWPEHISPNRRDSSFASAIDLMPTFLDVANVKCPECVQGYNLMPLLQDNYSGGEIRSYAYSEYGTPELPYSKERLETENLKEGMFTNPGNRNVPWEGNPVSLAGRIRMIRNHDWKYVQDGSDNCELYNLVDDPYELVNLWNKPECKEVQQRLESALSESIRNV